jgi:ribosomal protein S18 acetylase RimI-like enzyme
VVAEQQFEARRRHHATRFPGAEQQIVLVAGRPVGHLWVHREPSEWRLIDLAILPGARGRGVGTAVLRDLLAAADAASVPIVLSVRADNVGARRLYERLGFAAAEEGDLDVVMARPPRA